MGIFDRIRPQVTPTPEAAPAAAEAPPAAKIETKAVWGKDSIVDNVGPTKGVYESVTGGLHKAYMPLFMYRPLYGYPRDTNTVLMRQLGATAYIHAIISTIQFEATTCPWGVRLKRGYDATPETEAKIQLITDFFNNPNENEESNDTIDRMLIRDILEMDSGIIVKVYNRMGELAEMYARDGASFLKSPDEYGRMGPRAEYIPWTMFDHDPQTGEIKVIQPEAAANDVAQVRDMAAYWQYSWSYGALPVPYGKREIVWISQFPRSESPYGRSPLEVLGDVLYILLYGTATNLDLYLNNNIPEGVIQLLGAEADHITAFRERMSSKMTERDIFNNNRKKWFTYPIVNQEVKFTPFMLDPGMLRTLEQQAWYWKLVLACFGVTSDEMGFTEDSNKAVGIAQAAVSKRRAIAPILKTLAYHKTTQIIETDFNSPELEFYYDDYDVNEDIKKHELYEKKLSLGLATVNEIREKEGLPPLAGGDLSKFEQDMALMGPYPGDDGQTSEADQAAQLRKDEKKAPEAKSQRPADMTPDEHDFENKLTKSVQQIEDELTKILGA